jgi:N-acetylglutamate synthase-like GNAT family acetyltransferase
LDTQGKINKLTHKDEQIIFDIVNKAAVAYKGKIPADCYHEPYMPRQELRTEMGLMTFYGWQENKQIIGVMAIQPVKDVTLIRHAYILPDNQRKGIGAMLLDHLKRLTVTRYLLVGTWADATWAVEFYEKHGFRLMPDKDALLKKYWTIPPRQIETSVVLGIEL